ncbi:class I SAM-dependent methyltransferase, partial [Candidatus Woesearchaeota archaeon]|nr:class I SAM-dependent methyltransferase [Candidatus Woesearchaeota archaeon]
MEKCPICDLENSIEVSFCDNCRYPLNVKKMDEFSVYDKIIHFSSLFETVKNKKSFFKDEKLNELYDEFFSLYWLRPETAIFSFVEASLINRFRDKYLKFPVLDLGCGEGLFSAVAFGSKINKKYDSFEVIDFSKVDPYDSYEELPEDFFIKKGDKIGIGIDIKENSVKKAKDLGVFDEVKVSDVRKLKLEDKSVNSVYSNMFDDIKKEDLDEMFKEINRVLKDEGYVVFTTPTENFKDFLFYYNKSKKLKIEGKTKESDLMIEYDRGRSEWESRSLDFWKNIFKNNSFELVEYVEYANEDFLKFWDTGFRAFFKDALNIKNQLKEKNLLLSVK